MPISMNAAKVKRDENDQASADTRETRRAVTLDAREAAEAKSDLMENSTTANNARWVKDSQNKGRAINPSKSPDRYHINNNLVVNLAEPIKKPNELQIRMNQTQYKQGHKGNFFPSTATATTQGSSGQGSNDPRRTTDATSRQTS